MKTLARYALWLSFASLGGCAGSQPPIGVPVTFPQDSAMGVSRTSVRRLQPAASYAVLHRFGDLKEGRSPTALVNLKGTFYGIAGGGGSGSFGIVYRLSTTGEEGVLHRFGHGADGAGPSGLIDVNGTLYGTTSLGGSYDYGTVFRMSTTGAEKLLHSFNLGSDGWSPLSPIDVNGTLYGTTVFGGSGCGSTGCGTVYSMSTTGVEKLLYRFKGGSQGADEPDSDLIDASGTLYGTTGLGGNTGCYYHNGCGTVFGVTTTGAEKLFYAFKGGSDGAYPRAGLVDVNGTLYGTTSANGNGGGGTVYSISPDGVEKVVYHFGSYRHDARGPQADLINVNGTLYGTTWGGGSSGSGTVFRISTTGSEKVLHSFTGGSDGAFPTAALIFVKGALYGTTYYGGGSKDCKYGCGTVFAMSL